MIEPLHPDDEGTPTVRELWQRKDGSAEAVSYTKEGEPTKFLLTEKGHTLLNGIMRRNAERALARGSVWRDAVETLRRARAVDKGKVKSNGRKSTRSPS